MANGATKMIWQIKPGDVVLGYNPYTKEFYPNVVLATVNYPVYQLYIINNNITTDAAELFYVYRNSSELWVAASKLKVGDMMFNPLTGEKTKIYSIKIVDLTAPITVYDIIGAQGNSFIAEGTLADATTT
ncbi:MAG: Hint domain-containing protein [Candidatus Micrarchaeia archaeon]|jgi:hypothetical protein